MIEFLDPSKEPFLEYDVAKLLVELTQPNKPVVGWLSSIPMSGGLDPVSGQERPAWLVYTQAQQLFTVRSLSPTMTQVDPDVDVLVLVHPKDLPPAATYAIDQYALRGGRLLVFIDPIAEQDAGGRGAMLPGASHASSLQPLLSAWGVSFDPGEVLGDLEQGLTVRVREPLIRSSTHAAPIPARRFSQLTDPATLREGFKATGETYTVAARVTGTVKTAFPNGPPAGTPAAAGPAPLASSSKPLNLVVVADADMLSDFLWVRWQNFLGQRTASAWANNGDFVWNALDNLAGSSDLISVRGRASFLRPFERVDALRAAAEDRLLAKQKELEVQLTQTEQKLDALQTNRGDSVSTSRPTQAQTILTADQERELQRFQQERLRIRRELRDVKLGLDRDIQALATRLKVIDIVLAPAAFALVALLIAVAARRRRRPAAAASAASLGATSG